jgi:hypothetical protein
MLTGVPLRPVAGPQAGTGDGISLDQYVAGKIGATTKLRTLDLGVVPVQPYFSATNFVSFLGPGKPVIPSADPIKVFQSLFADLAGPDVMALDRAWKRRRSVLDGVRAEYEALSRQLGADDVRRMDEHLETVRRLEQRLGRTPPSEANGTCRAPAAPPALDSMAGENYATVGKLQMDLLVAALTCDLTRVGTLLWGGRGNNARFPWIGIGEEHHELSHAAGAATTDKLIRINAWYAQQFAHLIERLQAVKEGEGTIFDRSLIFWCNDLGDGRTHGHLDVPYVLAGNAGGALRTGQYLRFSPRAASNDVLVSVLNAMGIPDTRFGKAEWCTGPLRGLT